MALGIRKNVRTFDDVRRALGDINSLALSSTSDHGVLSGLLDDDHTQYSLVDGTRDFTGSIKVSGTIKLLEQADADVDLATYGQIWTNTAIPNELYFTDDAGNDRKIVYSGGTFHDGFSDFVANEHIDWTAASAGTVHSSNITQPGARVHNSVNQTLTSGSRAFLTFDSERWDNDSIHSTSTNTERMTCKTAGKYIITGNVQISGHATGIRQISFFLNGTTTLAMDRKEPEGTGTEHLSLTTIYDLAVNDYVDLRILQNSGGDLNTIVNTNDSPEFSMIRVGV